MARDDPPSPGLTRGGQAQPSSWPMLEPLMALPTQSQHFIAAISETMLRPETTIFHTITASDDDGATAVLPLCRERSYFSRWRMVGANEVYETGDTLARDAMAVNELAGLLARQRRAIDLARLPSTSPLLSPLRSHVKGRALLWVRPARATPRITLHHGWEEPESQFNAGRRSDFRRAARHAAAMGDVEYSVLMPDADCFDALFDEAVAVEQHSWKSDAGSALAVDPEKRQFFRRYFRAARDAGQLRLCFMRINGQAVAMQMAMVVDNRFWLFKIGYDDRFKKCSPGNLLMLHSLAYAAHERLQSYELLGNMEDWIAAFWTRDHYDCVRVRTYPFNLHGLVHLTGDTVAWLRTRRSNAPA